jgi:penicillin-binding protein 1A
MSPWPRRRCWPGLPKAPSAYNPIANPRRATQRQRYIIDRMFETGFITEAQHDEALAQVLRYRTQSEGAVHAEFVAEAARQLVFAQYGDDTYTRGLNVHLTVTAADQIVAYKALRKGLMDYELRQVYRGPEAYVNLPADAELIDARVAEALAEHPDNDELRSAVVMEASPRKVVALLQSGDAITVTGEGLRPVTSGLSERAGPKIQIRRGAVVRTLRNAKGDWMLTQLPEVEGAMVAMEPSTGAVRAMVGGFSFGKNKFNHVTQAWRQPGSSFKPFIYSAALEKGFTPGTVVNDAPLFFSADRDRQPTLGTQELRRQVRRPDAAAHRAGQVQEHGVDPRAAGHRAPFAQEWLENFGFEADKHPAYLTMALGAGSVTPLQMATAYSVFANGGLHACRPCSSSASPTTRAACCWRPGRRSWTKACDVLPARNAFVMSTLLQGVTRYGTAATRATQLKRTTSTARPAPPTTRWTPGLPAFSQT